MSNTFGQLLRLTTFGESHGAALGATLDGLPAGLPLDVAAIQHELDRRRPGQSKLTTQRKERDEVEVLSGVFEGRTTGMPIGLLIRNADAKPADYSHLQDVFRPGHADYPYHLKYGHRDYRGGGRSSARETAMRVAAGAIAKQLLAAWGPVEVMAWVQQIGEVQMPGDAAAPTAERIEATPVRCPHPATARAMEEHIREVRKAGDSVGGVVACRATGLPAGLGDPVFSKLHAELGQAILGINAVKGFEIGSGFAAAGMRGSQHNDLFDAEAASEGHPVPAETNHAGGVLGGISTGMPIAFRAAFKPVGTLMRDQPSINAAGEPVTLAGKGRHDPCVLPRAVPIVEAMTALVLADHWLRARARNPRFPAGDEAEAWA